MARGSEKKVELPEWVREALREGDPTDDLPDKRTESRHVWTVFCTAQTEDEPSADAFTARVFNVCSGGIGLIVRKELRVGQRLRIRPEGISDQTPVRARIIHCTRTVQGHKVGCAFEPL